MQQLILASTSPRRRDLLALLGLSFEICAPSFEEQPVAGLLPIQQAERFALEKARSVAAQQPEHLVLGSDTVIELDGRMLGKPADLADAGAMLAQLAGRAHRVHSTVALCCTARRFERVGVETATVWMKSGREFELASYLRSGESLGKAGAYSIQGEGSRLIARIDGDYTAVVGLPLRLVARLLTEAGQSVPVDLDAVYRATPYPNWAAFSSSLK